MRSQDEERCAVNSPERVRGERPKAYDVAARRPGLGGRLSRDWPTDYCPPKSTRSGRQDFRRASQLTVMSSEVETPRVAPFKGVPPDFSTSLGITIFAALDVYHDHTPHSAAMNMAIDEALLEYATIPLIRFYRWQSSALSFGYFGRFADIARYQRERDLVRRWTGGGIVFHGEDLTYSLVIPTSDTTFDESSMSIYEKIH